MRRFSVLVVPFLALLPPEDESSKARIAQALAKAKKENQRVLVVFGAPWCGWCKKLDELFKSDAEIRRLLLYEYRRVEVDVGRFDRNLDVAEKYGADLREHGIPFLTVLDAEGNVLANQQTGALEEGERHDPARVKAVLEKWKATPQDAESVLARALERAASEGKRVFLHLGAPW